MNIQNGTLTLLKALLLLATFTIASGGLIKGISVPGQGAQEPSTKETAFEDEIPKHVPIKIKIKKDKEAAFKDLKNKRWARDFELEVTNTGTKPIYSLSLLLVTDLKAAAGFRIVASLFYGKLGEMTDRATPEDIPIKPGETYVLKIHPGQLNAWDTIQLKENRPHPKRIQLKFQGLNFGDGTGLIGEDGEAIPSISNPRAGGTGCLNAASTSALMNQAWGPPNRPIISSVSHLPTVVWPVKFLAWSSLEIFSFQPLPLPQDCCPGGPTKRIHRSS